MTKQGNVGAWSLEEIAAQGDSIDGLEFDALVIGHEMFARFSGKAENEATARGLFESPFDVTDRPQC
jgi:hypothetical protein